MRNDVQFFNQPITEIIKKRSSIRSYKSEKVSKEVEEKLRTTLSEIKAPFNSNVRFEIIHDEGIGKENDGKIGTYGVIKGAKTYLLGIVETGDKDLEDLGYTFEKALLYATSLDLGSCWLGGTFRKSSFVRLANLKEKEILPIVSPIGYRAEKKSFIESAMRLMAGSNHRKDWKELFFKESFNQPLNQQEAGVYQQALETVRLAPSASNKQPWRVVVEGQTCHFFLQSTKGYGKALGFNIQRVDMGIAMCHFEMTVVEAGIKGSWKILKDLTVQGNEDTEYLVSWVLE